MSIDGLIRAAIYIRVSTLDQAREGYSLAAQERSLRDFCAGKGWKVYHVYADEGLSAKDITHRPAMIRMLEDAEAHRFNVICVWALSRYTRSVADLYTSCERLAKIGVDLISYTEPFNTRSAMGRAMRGCMGVWSQLERELTSERVKAAAEERALQGKRTCSYILGYDIVKGGDMVIIPHEADIIRYVDNTYLESRCILTTRDMCRAKGYVGKRGGALESESIYKILTQFTYCGYYSWHRQPIKGNFEAIRTIRTHNEIQRTLQERGALYGSRRQQPLIFLPE